MGSRDGGFGVSVDIRRPVSEKSLGGCYTGPGIGETTTGSTRLVERRGKPIGRTISGLEARRLTSYHP
jgi:hypothetical protein